MPGLGTLCEWADIWTEKVLKGIWVVCHGESNSVNLCAHPELLPTEVLHTRSRQSVQVDGRCQGMSRDLSFTSAYGCLRLTTA